MPRLPLLLVLMLGLMVQLTVSAPAAEKADAAKLVAQLGSADFEEREAAATALEALGAPALEALRQGVQSEDPEVRMRSTLLVKKLEARIASTTLLAGKRVHLVYKNAPVSEALADFNKQSGYTINLVDPQNALKDRMVTLDTGEVTFWQALDKFCEAAGLVEANTLNPQFGQPVILPGRPINRRPLQPVPVAPPVAPVVEKKAPEEPKPDVKKPENAPKEEAPKKPAEDKPAVKAPVEEKPQEKATAPKPVEIQAVQARQLIRQQAPVQAQPAQPAVLVLAQVQVVQVQIQPAVPPGVMPINPINPGIQGQGITLMDGKGANLPTDASGAIRVRAVDPTVLIWQIGQPNDKEILLALQASPEPKLQCQFLPQVRITKAVDENGQNLVVANPAETEIDPNVVPNQPGIARPAIRRIRPMPLENIFPVRLKVGNQPSKTIKELRGVLTAQVLGDSQPIITVDEVLKAANKTFKGGDNGVLRVLDVKKQADGQVEVRFEFEAPRDVVTMTNAVPMQPVVQFQPAVPIQPGLPAQPVQPGLPIRPGVRIQPVGPVPAVQPVVAPVQGPIAGPALSNHGFTMLDDKGNPLPLVTATSTNRADGRGGFITEYRMVFRSAKADPTRLVFTGQRNVTLDVPFTLKDVNVP